MIQLFLDTSQSFLILGIVKNDQTFKLIEKHGNSLGAALSLKLIDLLKTADVNFQDLSEIIVGAGPGSYTGTRVGVAFAEGLGYGLGIPVKKISSLAFYLSPNQSQVALKSSYGQTALLSVIESKMSYSLSDQSLPLEIEMLDIKTPIQNLILFASRPLFQRHRSRNCFIFS